GELCSPRNVAGGFGRGQGRGPHPSPPISIEEVPPAKPIVQPAPRHEPRRNEASPIKAPPHEAPSEAPPAATTPPPALETPAATTAASDPCAPAQTSQSGVAGEARLVTDGVRARRSGRSACALSLLDAHARVFPDGVLAEERDAERALALAALGRTAEARTAATAFLRKYPASTRRGSARRDGVPAQVSGVAAGRAVASPRRRVPLTAALSPPGAGPAPR